MQGIKNRTFVRGGVKLFGDGGISLFVFVAGLTERKARNAKTPQMTRQPTPPETSPSEKPLKADKRNKTARLEKIRVFFFIQIQPFYRF